MKNSNKILLGIIGFLVLLQLVTVASLRISFENSVFASGDYSGVLPSVSKSFGFEKFDKIAASGFWNIRVTQGTEYHIEVSFPESTKAIPTISVNDGVLELMSPREVVENPQLFKAIDAEIVLPALSKIKSVGLCQIDLSGIKTERLEISVEGSSQVSASDTRITDLAVTGAGTSEWNLAGAAIQNADFQLKGYYSAELSMNGGKLSGALGGFGKMTVFGLPDMSELKTNIMSNIINKDPGSK